MRTPAMTHQTTALTKMLNRTYYALFMEQGTGKTWCLLADAERLYTQERLLGMLVIAPNGVHTNWVRKEIPEHSSVPLCARAWKSGAGIKYRTYVDDLFTRQSGEPLRILTMNIDALITKAGFGLAHAFLQRFPSMMVVDESSDIKSPTSARTKACMKLRPLARYARIADGTPAPNSPPDVFMQMEFLHTGLLGTTNYRAFVAEYAEILAPNHPMMQRMIQRNPRIARAQIIARDAQGKPKYKNLGKLQKLLAKHSYRVRKDECLDLPEKIYTQQYFTLSPSQQTAYQLMKEECRMEVPPEDMVAVQALGVGTKLQEITSGFLLHNNETHYIAEGNTRLAALVRTLKTAELPCIVWARFREEIAAIMRQLAKESISAMAYYGDTSAKDRELAIDQFQSGGIDVLVANQQAAGRGRTLTTARTVIYYSNDFSLRNRLQSEDRCHRKGTTYHVVYIDLIAEHTIDERIVYALQTKTDMAAAIMGDLAS